jgi:PAS domain S-box-containing protein
MMDDDSKSKSQLVSELAELRRRVTELETAEANHNGTEEDLYHSQEMLQLVLDTIPQRVFWKDRNFSYLGCNRPFARDAGLDDPNAILGKHDFELGWKDLAQSYRDDDMLVMETDTPKLNFEEPETTPEGGRIWVRTSKVPLHDRDGNVIGILGAYEDITEQKQMEEALRHERILLRTLIDNLPDVIYAKDVACRKTLSNLADVHLMGFQSEAEVLGKSDFNHYPKEIAERFFADDESVVQTGQPVLDREEYVVDAEGRKRWLFTSKLPLRDSNGNIIGLVGIGRDITKRKQAEEALAAERNLLRTLIDNLPDLIYVKDTECRKTIANVEDVRNMGCQSEAEVMGKNDFDFYPKEIAAKFYADDQSVLQSGLPVLNREEYLFDPEGKKSWLSTSKLPLRNDKGQVIGLVGIGRVITEQKRAEEQLQQERNLLRAVIDNVPDLIHFKDAEGRYVLNNRAHLRSLGVEHQEEVLGKTTFDFHPQVLAKQYHEDEMRIVRTGEPLSEREELAVHRDTGEQRWHLTSKIPLKDDQGRVTGVVGISRDITEMKLAQSERERLINELQSALADLKTLGGLVPICANCKKIRDDKGYWTQVEAYIQERSEARFSHGICPDCAQKLYPDFYPKKKA